MRVHASQKAGIDLPERSHARSSHGAGWREDATRRPLAGVGHAPAHGRPPHTREAGPTCADRDRHRGGTSGWGHHRARDHGVDSGTRSLVPQDVPEAGPACPCTATSSTGWRAVDAAHVHEVMMALLTRVRTAERQEGEHTQVARDGTTVRGTQNHLAEDHKKRPPVKRDDTATGIVLTEQIGGDPESCVLHPAGWERTGS
jgi:hypothetical protein